MIWTPTRISKIHKNMSLFLLLPLKQRKKLLRMCVEAAKGFELLCGRENGFKTSKFPLHQTMDLHKLQPQGLKSMLTNNICD